MPEKKYATTIVGDNNEEYEVMDEEARAALATKVDSTDPVWLDAIDKYNAANEEANKNAALAKLSVDTTTDGGEGTDYDDRVASKTVNVTVKLTFDGNRVNATSVPTGWTEAADTDAGTGIKKYTKSATQTGVGVSSVAATTFAYTPSEGNYTKSISKKSTEKTVKIANVLYWGWSSESSADNINTIIGNLTRGTAAVSNSTANWATGQPTKDKVKNNSGGAAYLWIVTKGSVTATQSGNSILNAAVTGKTITCSWTDTNDQPQTKDITGYSIYRSTNTYAATPASGEGSDGYGIVLSIGI